MAANSSERLSEVILPKSGKERPDASGSEGGAVLDDRQEAMTHGTESKGKVEPLFNCLSPKVHNP